MDQHYHGGLFWQVSLRAQFWAYFFTKRIKDQCKNSLLKTPLYLLLSRIKTKCQSNALKNDLSLISKWAFNWNMLFNPNLYKPAQESLFLRKKKVSIHPVIHSILNIILTIRFAKLIKV